MTACEDSDPDANRGVVCTWCGVALTWWDGKEECLACGPAQAPCRECGQFCPRRLTIDPCWMCGDEHYCDECCRFVICPESGSGHVEPVAWPTGELDPCCEIVDKGVFERFKALGHPVKDFRQAA